MDDWCILRTASVSTLRLAQTLADDGYEAWAPVESWARRVPRTNKIEKVAIALLPSFVFARADRLEALVTLSHSPTMTYQVWDADQRRMVTKGHPYFRLFRTASGDPALVSDRALDPLRTMEQQRRPKGEARVFKPGDPVKLLDAGGLDGLIGQIDRAKGKKVWVKFPGWAAIEILSWKLLPLDVDPQVHVEAA